jgi:hypothetical protein
MNNDHEESNYDKWMSIDFDAYNVGEIDRMIASGICTEPQVVWYYNNTQWRDEQ